jgi:hypothetical protein
MRPAAERVDKNLDDVAVPAQQADLINKSFAQLAQSCAERLGLQPQGDIPHAPERIGELLRLHFAARLRHGEALQPRGSVFGAGGGRAQESARRHESGDGERPSPTSSGGPHAPLPGA